MFHQAGVKLDYINNEILHYENQKG